MLLLLDILQKRKPKFREAKYIAVMLHLWLSAFSDSKSYLLSITFFSSKFDPLFS